MPKIWNSLYTGMTGGKRSNIGMLAGFSQISDVPGLGDFADLFLYLGGIRKIGR
jgi:hypothetical protein